MEKFKSEGADYKSSGWRRRGTMSSRTVLGILPSGVAPVAQLYLEVNIGSHGKEEKNLLY